MPNTVNTPPPQAPGGTIHVPCRYYRVYTDLGVPCRESNFGFVERSLPVPVAAAALVLVDVWSVHYIETWLARAHEVTQTKIVPLLASVRRLGMTVIHAPSPYITTKRGYRTARPDVPAATAPPGPDWPPAAFRGIYRAGEYVAFGRDQEPSLPPIYEWYARDMDIAEPARPLAGEPVIATGPELHAVLAERRILHLFYAGFATNWCLIGRDYGIIAMNERGYNVIVVRDATAGIEFHDTVAEGTATAMTLREVETKYAWSTMTAAFVEACGGLG